MDLEAFIPFILKQENATVLAKVLRKAKIVKETEGECVFHCENLGSKMFLDSQRFKLSELFKQFNGTEKSLVFLVDENAKKKKRKKDKDASAELPLMSFQDKKDTILQKSGVLEHLTFDAFAVSTSNHIAHAAAKAVAEKPGQIYNPLFIYGDVGVGKTHITHAVANSILKNDVTKKVLYCTSETFTNDLVETIRQKNTTKHRKKYRELDVLIIDDAQFIAGKKYVQEEFYHTFNTIVQRGGQIILTSDRPPKEISELEDRLRSRFSGGLIIDMQKPDFELRTAILLIKAQERKINIDMDAAQHLAQKIRDTRELEGALLKMLSLSIANNSDRITVDSTRKEMERHSEKAVKRMPPQEVIKTVATYYGIKQSEIKSATRKQNIALARQVVMYLLRTLFDLNYEEIALLLKRKDHTTIMHGFKKVQAKIMKDSAFKDEVTTITDQLI